MNKRTVVRCVLLGLAILTVTPVFYRQVTGRSLLEAVEARPERSRQQQASAHQVCKTFLMAYLKAGDDLARSKVAGWRILAQDDVAQRERLLEQVGVAYLDANCRMGPLLGAITLVHEMQHPGRRSW